MPRPTPWRRRAGSFRVEVVVGKRRRPQRLAQPGHLSARERRRAKVIVRPGGIRGFDPDDGRHATCGLGFVAPSSRPISRSFAFSDIVSRLRIGRRRRPEMRFMR